MGGLQLHDLINEPQVLACRAAASTSDSGHWPHWRHSTDPLKVLRLVAELDRPDTPWAGLGPPAMHSVRPMEQVGLCIGQENPRLVMLPPVPSRLAIHLRGSPTSRPGECPGTIRIGR